MTFSVADRNFRAISRSRARFTALVIELFIPSIYPRQLIDLSEQIEKVYTSTRLCIPKSLNICLEPEKLWTSTFLKLDDEFKQLTFDPEIAIEAQHFVENEFKCFTGEPELEKLMANGN